MRWLMIEERDSGMYRVVNGEHSIEVLGHSIHEALGQALLKKGISVNSGWNTFEVAEALDTLMGRDATSWKENLFLRDWEGHVV